MLAKILMAWCLVVATVFIHVAGLALVFGPVLRWTSRLEARFWSVTWLLIRTTGWLVAIHCVEIAAWAIFFWWQGCVPDAESAFYFSGVTYTTLGYGDVVLPSDWRIFGPVEALTGILMCALSTGFLLAVVNKMYARTKS